jgi:hypothetical protein
MLERFGQRFDLTVEPGESPTDELNTIEHPDYGPVETKPYRPSTEDFRKSDPARRDGLWIIPLTPGVMSGDRLRWRRYLRARWSSVGSIPTGFGTLRLWEPPALVQPAIEKTLQNLDRPYLAFAIRSDVLLNPWWRRDCQTNLETLLERVAGGGFVFCTPQDAIRSTGIGGG